MDIAEAVSGLSYKPGWRFNLEYGSGGRYWLCITAAVLHSQTLQPVTFEVKRIIPRIALDDLVAFLSWWEDILAETEFHELREFARYKGELIDDPHESKPAGGSG